MPVKVYFFVYEKHGFNKSGVMNNWGVEQLNFHVKYFVTDS